MRASVVERKATGDPAETFNELLGRAVQHGYARLLAHGRRTMQWNYEAT
jgi:hypothetical protein